MTQEELDSLLDEHRRAVRADVPRDVLVTFIDRVKHAAAQSKRTVVKEGVPAPDEIRLAPQRANKVAGLIRHEFVDEVFNEIADQYGGERIGSIKVSSGDKTENKPLFLSTFRFGGTLLGFGSHFQRDDLPRLNKTRRTLCSLNEGLLPDLFRKPQQFKENERFAVLMLQRSSGDIGSFSSMSIGVVDAKGSQFVFQDELSDFLAGYGSSSATGSTRKIVLRQRKQDAAAKA